MSDFRIIIPEKLYAGVRVNKGHSYFSSALTAWGSDSSAKGRMDTIHRSVGGEANARILDNEALFGFELLNAAGRDEWWVRDPRGLVVNVKNHMIAMLMHNSVIVNGVIQQSCCWGRAGGVNVLLNTDSALYQDAVNATRVANMKANWKNAQVGNRVTLQNGKSGVYMGKYYRLLKHWSSYNKNNINTLASDDLLNVRDPAHVLYIENAKGNYGYRHTLLISQNPKLAEIDSTTSMDSKEAELLVNEYLHSPQVCEENASYMGGATLMLTSNKLEKNDIQLSVTELTSNPVAIKHELTQWGGRRSSIDQLSCRLYDGSLGHMTNSNTRHKNSGGKSGYSTTYSVQRISEDKLEVSELRYKLKYASQSRGNTYYETDTVEVQMQEINQLCYVQLSTKTSLGNQFSLYV
jgi:hypothetical protein